MKRKNEPHIIKQHLYVTLQFWADTYSKRDMFILTETKKDIESDYLDQVEWEEINQFNTKKMNDTKKLVLYGYLNPMCFEIITEQILIEENIAINTVVGYKYIPNGREILLTERAFDCLQTDNIDKAQIQANKNRTQLTFFIVSVIASIAFSIASLIVNITRDKKTVIYNIISPQSLNTNWTYPCRR